MKYRVYFTTRVIKNGVCPHLCCSSALVRWATTIHYLNFGIHTLFLPQCCLFWHARQPSNNVKTSVILTEITEPHMRNFVSHSQRHAQLGSNRRILFIANQSSFSEGNQSPVFHGSGHEIGNRDQVCKNYQNTDQMQRLEVNFTISN